jgi:PAS domain S-box-containing protein
MEKVKILVVEDNRIVAEDIKNNLEEMGYIVSGIATSGEKALEAAAAELPDIAIMDIRLGKGMNGIETAAMLRQNYRIPIIYLTAHADEETVSEAKKTEPYAYLIKPFDTEELQSAVEIAIYRYQMERKARESEQWLLTTLKSIGDGVIATDWQGRVKFMNAMAEKMTGWPQSEAVGKPLPEVFHIINEITREIVADPAAKVIATGQIIGLANHTLLVRRDGTEIPIKDSGAPIVLKEGEPIGVVLVFQDDTASRAAENRLRESRERLYLAMESASEGLWEWHTVEDLMIFDDLCYKMLGFESGSPDGGHRRWWMDRIHRDDLPSVREAMGKMLSGGNGSLPGVDYRISKKDGTYLWVTSRAKIIQRGDDGKPLRIVGVQRDIHQRKMDEDEKAQLERELRQSQKMEAIGTLTGGIAHDFNNILASVIGYTELALEDAVPGSLLQQNLNEIMVAGLRARDLVRQILMFSRHADTQLTRVEINALTVEAIKMMRATIPTSIAIHDDFAAGPIHIQANPSQIHQVIVNLCTNAFHAMEEDGGTMRVALDTVRFEAHVHLPMADIRPGRYACISVSDSGHGIEPQNLDRIFDPYFTTKDQEKGSGLGLSIVSGIVHQHGGYITVDSRPGDGSAFKVYFPILDEAVEEKTPTKMEPLPRGNGQRILLVDDEPAIAKVQKQSLERLGYVVEISTDSNEALERFMAEPSRFDLLLTDMTMPRMTGDTLAHRVREIVPDLPVILCTGFSEKMDPDRSRELNINCFLMKPIKKAKLADAIKDALTQSAPADDHPVA